MYVYITFVMMTLLQVRLVTLYQRTGRISEGWQHCCEVELRQPWPACREWYSCMVEMSENYQVMGVSNIFY